MKKYTIKEFAEGKKAVKIENEEQWNKLNKVHKLTTRFYKSSYYDNTNCFSSGFYTYPENGYETLEFSQLNFEDEFVEGWYKSKIIKSLYRNILRNEVIWSSHRFEKDYNVKENFSDWKLLTDLSEIQPFLPSNYPDLMKKDTFVLPEFWYVVVTKENQKVLQEWRFPKKDFDLNDYIGGIVGISPKFPNGKNHNPSPNDSWGEGSIEITFEQFQQYVLKTKKEENMEQIIGYKLVKPEYELATIKLLGWNLTTKLLINISEKGDIQRLKEAGVLDLWFEKVYAPEFKENDWVFVKYANGNGVDKTGLVSQLFTKEVTNATGKLYKESDFCVKQRSAYLRIQTSDIVRLATIEEIKAAQIQLPTINGYSGSYENGIIKYGCAEFSKMFFEHLNSTNSHLGNRTIKSIKLSSNVEITIEEIKQIVEYINKK